MANRFGGIDKMAQLLDYVSSNGKIQEFIQNQINGQPGGVDDLGLDEMSPEGKKAVALVKKIVQTDSGRMINQALANFQRGSLDPFLATYQEEKLESLFDRLVVLGINDGVLAKSSLAKYDIASYLKI